ncbi:HAD family hydrolase [Vreelandella alkaliphila]|uniref:HAD family hydrolase n=1 Tax=Vreelandella alkaliphila TaxID=272774 RepID=UPI00232B771C|nr:HAD family hydrolase [Halomonas alkaliphila]
MKQLITEYRTLVFDCDGVVLNSNRVKTDAFYQTALPYGEAAAQALVDYHVQNGGISRYLKFAYFLEHIVARDPKGPELGKLLARYAEEVIGGLKYCDIAPGLTELRANSAARWLIVSGGDQSELREVFTVRGIASLFDGGIFGSPDTKDAILTRELMVGNIQFPALFLGDSKYDFHAATQAGLAFIFLHGWSEVSDWKLWADQQRIVTCHSLADLACIAI